MPLITRMPYGVMASLIVAFTAVTSIFFSMMLPFSLGSAVLPLALFKASVVALWLWASWRVKDRREKAFQAKESRGDLWMGPIHEKALCIPEEDLEVIKYHLDADEDVKRVFRRHKYTLWKAILWLNIAFWSVVLALWMAAVVPSLEWHPSDIEGSGGTIPLSETGFSFVWWWLPLLITLFAFYEALKHWQIRKWTIRIITNKNLYLFREQPTYMPWIPPKFRVIPVHQVVGMDADVGSFGGMVGWTDIYLQVRADEHDDAPEPVIIDYVTEGNEVISDLRHVLPVFESRLPQLQVVLDDELEEDQGSESEEPQTPEPELEEQGDSRTSAQDQLF